MIAPEVVEVKVVAWGDGTNTGGGGTRGHVFGGCARHGTVSGGGGRIYILGLAKLVPKATILGCRVMLQPIAARCLRCKTLYT